MAEELESPGDPETPTPSLQRRCGGFGIARGFELLGHYDLGGCNR